MVARGPTDTIRAPLTTTVASTSGGPPLPSITVAPTIAVVPCPTASEASETKVNVIIARKPKNLVTDIICKIPFRLSRFASFERTLGTVGLIDDLATCDGHKYGNVPNLIDGYGKWITA